ncbi:hypothetical protein SULPSESMR1_02713 [Pseudosulfitobacter pseudonitzschiae]|uniref:Uncharacterized protein n=1 Tax=Pseudosulfitobacter pseudonitzschiae TaxID=1402135 RepID=A0A221K3C2_9RHOB|nr:hypothetical protein SULPSESMR1_02713 [Pseudosulfitobacter pseudonitzschiae]
MLPECWGAFTALRRASQQSGVYSWARWKCINQLLLSRIFCWFRPGIAVNVTSVVSGSGQEQTFLLKKTP